MLAQRKKVGWPQLPERLLGVEEILSGVKRAPGPEPDRGNTPEERFKSSGAQARGRKYTTLPGCPLQMIPVVK